jgi:hypothetical protein
MSKNRQKVFINLKSRPQQTNKETCNPTKALSWEETLPVIKILQQSLAI